MTTRIEINDIVRLKDSNIWKRVQDHLDEAREAILVEMDNLNEEKDSVRMWKGFGEIRGLKRLMFILDDMIYIEEMKRKEEAENEN